MKRILLTIIMLISVTVLFFALGTTASAETYGDLTYEVSNGEVTITDCSTTATEVVIPETIDGYPVTSIGSEAFRDCGSLKSISIPDSVTYIGSYAFYNCTSLKKVYAANVESWLKITFNNYASNPSCNDVELYFNNELVTDIVIPDGATSIGNYAFFYCTSLTSITIPDSVIFIGEQAFDSCTSLTTITIPDGVTSIGGWAFYDCTSLANVIIGDGVTTIGSYAFFDCDSLEGITVDDNNSKYSSDEYGVLFNKKKTELIQYLMGNTKTEYTIPDSVTSIGEAAFQDCTSLESITIPDSVTSIGEAAFNGCTSLESITIPDSVTNIDYAAFSQCYSLKKVYATSIESWLKINFNDFSSTPLYNGAELYFNNELVTDIVIPDSVTSVGSYAFHGYTSLKSITIPDSVTVIGYEAFGDCLNLENVTIGNSVARIKKYAFSGCSSLTSITIPDSLRLIEMSAFESCSSLKATFYTGTQEQWNNISIELYNSYLTSAVYYNVDEDYLLKNNVLFNKNGTMLVVYGVADRYYVIPDTVKSIEQNAFSGVNTLHTVILPQGLKNIGSYAFCFANNLTSIYIPSSVSTIDTYAFYGTNLTDVYFGGTQEQWNAITIGNNNTNLKNANIHYNSELVIEDGVVYNPDKTVLICYDKNEKSFTVPNTVKTIGAIAFKECKNLQQIVLPPGLEEIKSEAFYNCTALSEIVIPDSVTTIEDSAFCGCSALQNVESGDGLTTIGNSAFYGCTALENLTLPENLVAIGNYAFYGCTNLSEIYFPDSLESIGYSAFENCSELTYISLPDGLVSLGNGVFSNCSSLKKVCLPESGLASIPANAFNGCSKLSDIYIPVNITSFGDSAFFGCNLLTDIYFGGTEEQWNNISIVSSNSVIWAANIHYEHEHTFGEWTVLISTQRSSERTEKSCCIECGYEKRVSIDNSHVHDYTKVEETPATCTTAGQASYTCDCGLDYTKVLDKKGHTFANMTVDEQHLASVATCCSKAKYYYKCENCNIFSTNDAFEYGEYNSQNHTGGTDIRDAVTENCGVAGYTGNTYCLGCDTKISTGAVINATGNHNYSSEITTAATCYSTGVRTYTCSVCDDTYTATVEIDSANHTGGTEIRDAVAENCGNNGYTGDTYCLGCNTKISTGTVINATSNHNYSSKITTAATCNQAGVKTFTCSVCRNLYTEQIEKDINNHIGGTEIRNSKASTCTHSGYTGDTYCKGCNVKLSSGKEVAKLAHTEITVKGKAATCTEAGLTDGSKCSVCDTVINAQKVIPATGHKFGEWAIVKAPTATEEGSEERVCSVCGEKETRTIDKINYIAGDANGDGKVNAADARIVLRISAQLENVEDYNQPFVAFDMTGDGKINAADARLVLRKAARIDP